MGTRTIFLAFLMAVTSLQVTGQDRERELTIAFINNAVGMPFSGKAGIVHAPLHPGISGGYGKRINKNDKHKLLFNARISNIYQQRVQHIFQLYPELNYRPRLFRDLYLNTALGLGYVHSFSNLEQFKLNSNGEYERTGRGGRPAVFSALALGFAYNLAPVLEAPITPFVNYQLWFQSPFIKSYVPVLPNAALQVGVIIRLNRNFK